MRPVLSAALVALAGVSAFAQSTQPATMPSSTQPTTQPAVSWMRPTPMLYAMLATRSVPALRPPLRRGYISPNAFARGAGNGNEILRARTAATRAVPTTQTAVATGATQPTPTSARSAVTVVVNSKRPATRPAVEPTRLKIDLDAATAPDAAGQLSAVFGQSVRMQDSVGITFHGKAGTFAAAVAEFFTTSGFTLSDNSSDLTLTRGTPLRVVNLNDVGTLVLTRVTLSARRYLATEQPTMHDYTIAGLFVPDPAMGVLGITAADGVTVKPGPDRRRNGSPNGFQNMSGFRVNMNFTSPVPLKKADVIAGRIRGLRTLDEAAADVSFDQIADGQPVDNNGVTATVTIPAQMGSAALRVTLSGEKMSAFRDYRWQQSVRQFVRVLDLDGSVMSTETYPEQTDANSTRLMVRTNMRPTEFFDHLTTVRIRVPLTLKAMDLPFELKDVDLPGE